MPRLLKVLIPEEEFEINAEIVKVRGLNWGLAVSVLQDVEKHASSIMGAFQAGAGAFTEEAAASLFAEAPAIVNAVIRKATGRDQKWIDDLPIEVVITLATVAFELTFGGRADDIKKKLGKAQDTPAS